MTKTERYTKAPKRVGNGVSPMCRVKLISLPSRRVSPHGLAFAGAAPLQAEHIICMQVV